jgi:hypothetical protein
MLKRFKDMMKRFKDNLYEFSTPDGSYEEWTAFQMIIVVSTSVVIFLLSPGWIFEVLGRVFRMTKAKIKDGNLDTYYKEERAKAELEAYSESNGE